MKALLPLLTLLLGAAEPVVSSSIQKQKRDAHSTKAERQIADASNTSSATPALYAIYPSKNGLPCEQHDSRDDCELRAEWKSAQAAQSSAEWAKWQNILSGFGLVGLLITLHYSRRSTSAAIDASKDAERSLRVAEQNASALLKQVEVSKSASERHLRAYVGVEEIIIKPAEGERYAAKLKIRNYGLTPAYNCVISTASRVDTFPLIDPHRQPPEPESQSRDVTLYPSSSIPAFAVCDTSGRYEQIVASDVAVYVYGTIVYTDAEGTPRRSSFAYRGTGGTFLRHGEMHVCMGGNTAT